jgi:hypothetical protein
MRVMIQIFAINRVVVSYLLLYVLMLTYSASVGASVFYCEGGVNFEYYDNGVEVRTRCQDQAGEFIDWQWNVGENDGLQLTCDEIYTVTLPHTRVYCPEIVQPVTYNGTSSEAGGDDADGGEVTEQVWTHERVFMTMLAFFFGVSLFQLLRFF